MEFINRHDIMEYAPLHYPLPRLYFKLEIGRSSDESRGDAGDVDEAPLSNKTKIAQPGS